MSLSTLALALLASTAAAPAPAPAPAPAEDAPVAQPAAEDAQAGSSARYRRHRAPPRRARAGGADRDLGARRQGNHRYRGVQRCPRPAAPARAAILFEQPAQLGDQHPRPGRAVRPHQRRHRAGGRLLCRRRLYRPHRRLDLRFSSMSTGSRCCAGRRARSTAKNTTAGAINITTRTPSFTPEARVELSGGNYDFLQAKSSVSGPLSDTVAARISTSLTSRRGTIYNTRTDEHLHKLDNFGGPRPRFCGARRPASASPSPATTTGRTRCAACNITRASARRSVR